MPNKLVDTKARTIWENGYIDMPTIRGELKDFGCDVLDELKERLVYVDSHVREVINKLKQELQNG